MEAGKDKVPDSEAINRLPTEIYGDPQAPIGIRLSNGSAGPLGFIRALAEDYLDSLPKEKRSFSIAWLLNISRNGLVAVTEGTVDFALTYERDQEDELIEKGIAKREGSVFKDRFALVGPKSLSKKIPKGSGRYAAERAFKIIGTEHVPFLTRDDGSATNFKEHALWEAVNRSPWTDPEARSTWYQAHQVYPLQALELANATDSFTLIDRATWLFGRSKVTKMEIYVEGGTFLMNPCYAIVRAPSWGPPPSLELQGFLDYLMSDRAQLGVISKFGECKFGTPLFAPGLSRSKND